ncbi:uracil-DNA glycosylase-like protein [Mycotypha africana]|uniref:uracil-DNA glycosylase-like protein n=1 Tax=Mycotypha africana TaxID=64632 RepID=UPI002301061B|nr:uracil-DNA glycosylase-like protein [Mycotypha africana]KAI8973458.1 uracil-DNA glycosylase-like protein [Mycotypha africana]
MNRVTRSSSRTVTKSPYFKKETAVEGIEEKKRTVTKKKTTKRKTATTTTVVTADTADALTKLVPDLLDFDLKVLFVGINPGIMSGSRGHHYAGPTNHFWPCLSESGLVGIDNKVTYADDIHMPARYRLGFTNLTARTTRRASDLTLKEQQEGIPVLNEKLEKYRPRVACFVGKGIYEIYSNQKCKVMGLQHGRSIPWPTGDGETIFYVMPSTSGIVSAYQRPQRIQFFQDLYQVTQQQDKLYPPLKQEVKQEAKESTLLS